MDKETLSNYGWIVIAVLVLAIMIALATPFGSYISGAVKSTTQGLFDTNKNALNGTGLINIADQSFDEKDKQTSIIQHNGNDFTLTSYKGETWKNVVDTNNTVFGTDSDGYVTVKSVNGLNTLAATAEPSKPLYLLKANNKVKETDIVEPNAVYTIEEAQTQTSTIRNGIIPDGATYTIKATNTILEGNGTNTFPNTLTKNDVYEEGDYKYTYGGRSSTLEEKWGVQAKDKTKTVYGEIISAIAGKPVTDVSYAFSGCTFLITSPVIPSNATEMNNTFYNCTSLITAPSIPNRVTSMSSTFYNCKSLKSYVGSTDSDGDFSNYKLPDSVTTLASAFDGCKSITIAPTIPSSVTNMYRTFDGCTSLTTAPTIPSSVTDMSYTFNGCVAIEGTIKINANPTSYNGCFVYTQKFIYLTGTSTKLAELAATALNGNVTVQQ